MLLDDPNRRLNGWSEDAKTAITSNPDYFVWWYTAKSLLLVGTAFALAYTLGRQSAKKSHHKKPASPAPLFRQLR
jgi:hypothetical protein